MTELYHDRERRLLIYKTGEPEPVRVADAAAPLGALLLVLPTPGAGA